MLKSKIPLRVIAEVLGHKTLQMAMRYTHPDEDELRRAVETLDGLIE
jgi:integrase